MYSAIALHHLRKGEIVFSSPDIRPFFDGSIDVSTILTIMESQHGLLIQRAQGVYSFSHLTFQEYLAAKSFVEESDPDRWDDLLQYLEDRRWREVFVLIVSMVKADFLVRKIYSLLGQLVPNSESINPLLNWVVRKQEKTPSSYDIAAIRAFYLGLARRRPLPFRPDSASTDGLILDALGDTHDFYVALARVRDLDRPAAIAQVAMALDRALVLVSKDRDIAGLEFILDHALALARELGQFEGLKPEFLRVLTEARDAAKNNTLTGDQLNRVQQAAMRHRDVGHSFALSESDFKQLNAYEYVLSVLYECLRSERISKDTRGSILTKLKGT
jgi:hypothetical protein